MSCYYPMYRIEDYAGKIHIQSKSDFDNDIKYYWEHMKMNPVKAGYWKRADQIPCGKCIGCRLDYSREWANRIVLESKMYDQDESWFLTLTYNTENLPIKSVVDKNTGKIINGETLYKKDLQDFMKRLRKHYEPMKIRFYGAGEYGNKYSRPHYHICIFGLKIRPDKLKFHSITEEKNILYECEEIESIWGKGFITIGKLTWDSAAYTARYVMKKQMGPEADAYYASMAKDPEFVVMSLRPGIGYPYYEANKDKIYENDEIPVPKKGGAKKIKPPKYFDQKFKEENPERFGEISRARTREAKIAAHTKYKNNPLEPQTQREIDERAKTEQAAALKRTL